jgi:hypothetical protein
MHKWTRIYKQVLSPFQVTYCRVSGFPHTWWVSRCLAPFRLVLS